MSDIIIVVEEEAPSIVVSTVEQVPNVEIPSNSNVASLAGLSDVSVPSPQEGQVLTYKTGLWRAEDVVDDSIKSPLDGGTFN
jgi:hypothetical protein